jgi:ribosomal protein S18 acetylase RimI-like enzyme
MITAIEELSMNAWPSFQTLLYDGWVLRFAKGYTKRANSVNPLYSSTEDLDEKLRFCERVFQNEKMATVFKITPVVYPADLDEQLLTRGYRKDSPTSVQTLALEAVSVQPAAEASWQENLPDEWLDAYCQMNAVVEGQQETLRRILLNIIPRHCFMTLKMNGKCVACGLGVLQAEHLGLFDIVTDGAFRRRGYGRQVVESILAWGKGNGGRNAYLQVMLNNPPALHLYSTVGFVEKYQYWYRINP